MGAPWVVNVNIGVAAMADSKQKPAPKRTVGRPASKTMPPRIPASPKSVARAVVKAPPPKK